jgi:spoIIIJ-associated protein
MASEPSPSSAPASSLLDRYGQPIKSLVGDVIRLGKFQLDCAVRRAEPSDDDDIEAPEIVVDFSGPDAGLLLEGHAELLNALEYVVLRAVRLEESLFPKVSFDCEDYRRLRVEELKLMAQVAADRVLETRSPFPLGPMRPRERRVVHLALRDRPEVRTESEGYGPERKVVIHPASAPPPRRS